MTPLLAAVDVGTGSARAGIFDTRGRMLGRAECPIETLRLSAAMAAQDSGEIWRACCAALVGARAEAGAPAEAVRGVAFDATCSLVVREAGGEPIATVPGTQDRWDTILWLDHRAGMEAAECGAAPHRVLHHLGGVMSPEMALPKLMWLKRRMPEAWARAGLIFDLADFLSWKASGSGARSVCALACKWGYLPRAGGWQADYLARIGLEDLRARAGLPEHATPVGARLGGVTAAAAVEMGLAAGTPVAAGLIDAYAGALGVLGGARAPGDVALIAGTSTCVMALGAEPRFLPGVWGPFPEVMLPGLWVVEGGQSVSGALLDHLIRRWGAGPPEPALHAAIATRVAELRTENPDLAAGLHVLPDFQGNRSPLAEANARGAISGMDMGEGFDALCGVYWRGCVSLALALREVLDHVRAHGIRIERLRLAGGHARNPLLAGLYADATGLPVIEPEADAVLLGGAMVAAVGAGIHRDTAEAGAAMARGGAARAPEPAAWLERDWRVFQLMRRQRRELVALEQALAAGTA